MWKRFVAGWIVVAAVTCGIGGIVLLFMPLGTFAHFGWPSLDRLLWDAGLSFVFFLQHSGMVRRPVRVFLRVPEHYWSAVYAASSGIALIAVCVAWQSTDVPVYRFPPPLRIAAMAATLFALFVFVWGVVALRTFDLLGVRRVSSYLRGRVPAESPFIIRGPYRWVRHPLYSAVLIAFWAFPDPTLDRLLFNFLWTAWIIVGTRLEERDLIADFGAEYVRYQTRVPALIPWHAPRNI